MNLRNFVIWGVIVVVLIGLYSMMTGGGRATAAGELSYSQTLSKVNNGEVAKAVIRGAAVEITDKSGKTFTAITPHRTFEHGTDTELRADLADVVLRVLECKRRRP